jgi:hypothetical protein
MIRAPKRRGHIICPKDIAFAPPAKAEPMWKAMALPFHLIGKICQKCDKPVGEHYFFIQDVKP